jgi:hypothetical protein
MRPHQRHSRSSATLIEDDVITTRNMWPHWATVTSAIFMYLLIVLYSYNVKTFKSLYALLKSPNMT